MDLRQWILDKTRPRDAVLKGNVWYIETSLSLAASWHFHSHQGYKYHYVCIKPKWFTWVECTEWLSTNEKLGE